MPRRTRLDWTDEALLSRVQVLASRGLTDEQIAISIGVCRNTIQRHKKHDVAFVTAIKKGETKGILTVTNALFENAESGNLGAQIFYLKNRAGWKDKQDINHGSEDGSMTPKTFAEFYNGSTDS